MNNKEFLKIIKRKGVGTINGLPSGYDYSVSDKTLTLKLTKGVCDNMQNDTAVPLKLKLEIKIVYRIPINLIMKYGIGALYSNQQMPHFKSVRIVEHRRVLITRKLQPLSPFLTGH